MKIYTKTGDNGSTSLFGGDRLMKSDIRVEAYGTVDELNSYVGLLADKLIMTEFSVHLQKIQNILFNIGSVLATVDDQYKSKLPELKNIYLVFLEDQIDLMQEKLPIMTQFVLPGGHEHVSFTHVVRTVCRRAERAIVRIENYDQDFNIKWSVVYLNRLSDYFFVLSRYLTQYYDTKEVNWQKDITF
jgi:cob(I)alamin adenosyltransferase